LLIAALAEAQDINLHLKPLRSQFTGGQHRTAGRVGGVCCLLLPCLFVCLLIAALAEAQDINLHLKPLRSHFEEIEQAEFEDLQKHLEPMMHVVCLVWANSKYYNTPARIIILLQEICNLMILLVSAHRLS